MSTSPNSGTRGPRASWQICLRSCCVDTHV
jgi:hypothetical protein